MSGGNAAREAAVSAVGETKAQGTGKPGDRKNYAELLMSSAPSLLCSGRGAPCATPAFPVPWALVSPNCSKTASRPAFPPLTHYISRASAVSSPHRIEKGSLADDTGESERGCLFVLRLTFTQIILSQRAAYQDEIKIMRPFILSCILFGMPISLACHFSFFT